MKKYEFQNQKIATVSILAGDMIYLEGGYYSPENGCISWGSSEMHEIRFIGENMGEIRLQYEDGTYGTIPLIYGYTLWFHAIWMEDCLPFKTEAAEKDMQAALKQALYLQGVLEQNEAWYLAIRAPKNVERISIVKNERKEGAPVFTAAYTGDGAAPEGLENMIKGGQFEGTILSPDAPVPQTVQAALDAMNHRLCTFEEDFLNPPTYVIENEDFYLRFSGTSDAEIATGVFHENRKSMKERIDEEGFFHTSFANAPSWRYDGFGPWVNTGSYYTDYYSRDAGHALMTLGAMGFVEEVKKSLAFANRQMLFYVDEKLTLGGKQIPGHYSVVINKPLLYSQILAPTCGWPTQYTKERFKDEYQNLGNQETDGHGLMMMANVALWKRVDDPKAWVEENKKAIYEGARWILWCRENPEESFFKDGLLYAESEAGMNDYTLYCNLPCCLGLYGYADMAESIGDAANAALWRAVADELKANITEKLSENGQWNIEKFGFFHDPIPTMCADFFGYDMRDIPEEWLALSQNAYEADAGRSRGIRYNAKGGLGYNTAQLTQDALLLDQTEDADRMVCMLTRLCYAPRLPFPYFATEGASFHEELGAIRRQGDLGNLVQQAELLKAYLIVLGVTENKDGKLSLMPRLPKDWSVCVKDFPLRSGGTVDVTASYPKNEKQEISVSFSEKRNQPLPVRFGPFAPDAKPQCIFNGQPVEGKPHTMGDALWVDCCVEV